MASKFSSEKLEEIRAQFDQFDADGNGHITCSEIAEVLKALGETTPGYKIRDMIREVDIDENGTIEFNEFVEMYAKVTAEKKTYGLQKTADKAKKLVQVGGLSEASAEGTTHSFAEEEKLAFMARTSVT
uniref:EF-hand domain-containing protein n=1 Tax=Amphimedon queenslandica TaxID=400682 RepID=A0A1X7VVW7_AMPQE